MVNNPSVRNYGRAFFMRRVRSAICIIITAAAAVLLLAAFTVLPERLAFKCGENYRFFIGNTSADCREVICTPHRAAMTRLLLKDVCGESTTFETLDLEEFLKGVNGEIVFEERLDDSVNYYCRADLPYSINLCGKEINLHICAKQEGVTVASPIIFGGY